MSVLKWFLVKVLPLPAFILPVAALCGACGTGVAFSGALGARLIRWRHGKAWKWAALSSLFGALFACIFLPPSNRDKSEGDYPFSLARLTLKLLLWILTIYGGGFGLFQYLKMPVFVFLASSLSSFLLSGWLCVIFGFALCFLMTILVYKFVYKVLTKNYSVDSGDAFTIALDLAPYVYFTAFACIASVPFAYLSACSEGLSWKGKLGLFATYLIISAVCFGIVKVFGRAWLKRHVFLQYPTELIEMGLHRRLEHHNHEMGGGEGFPAEQVSKDTNPSVSSLKEDHHITINNSPLEAIGQGLAGSSNTTSLKSVRTASLTEEDHHVKVGEGEVSGEDAINASSPAPPPSPKSTVGTVGVMSPDGLSLPPSVLNRLATQSPVVRSVSAEPASSPSSSFNNTIVSNKPEPAQSPTYSTDLASPKDDAAAVIKARAACDGSMVLAIVRAEEVFTMGSVWAAIVMCFGVGTLGLHCSIQMVVDGLFGVAEDLPVRSWSIFAILAVSGGTWLAEHAAKHLGRHALHHYHPKSHVNKRKSTFDESAGKTSESRNPSPDTRPARRTSPSPSPFKNEKKLKTTALKNSHSDDSYHPILNNHVSHQNYMNPLSCLLADATCSLSFSLTLLLFSMFFSVINPASAMALLVAGRISAILAYAYLAAAHSNPSFSFSACFKEIPLIANVHLLLADGFLYAVAVSFGSFFCCSLIDYYYSV